jgi:hypothetical protein
MTFFSIFATQYKYTNMAKSLTNTRLYNHLTELLSVVISATENFPKSARYVAGAEMQRCAIRMLTDFSDAYTSNNASCAAAMSNLIANLETLKVMVSISIQQRWIYGQKKSGRLIRLLDSISIQSTALRNAFVSRFAKDEKSGAYETKVSATDASSD